MAPPIAHWDEVEPRLLEAGDIRGTWQRLADAAGSVGVGVNRVRLGTGFRSTPVHTHGASEELTYVLAGAGLLWQDGATHELGSGDCVVNLPYANDHTLIGGEGGLDVLIFGTRHESEFGALERAGVLRLGGTARLLAASGGSRRTGLNHVTLPVGERGAPPHCHSHE